MQSFQASPAFLSRINEISHARIGTVFDLT